MILSSFKSEQVANGPPKLFFDPTLDRYRDVMGGTEGVLSFSTALTNSTVVVLLSTLLVLAMAVPAAYALAIDAIPRWRDVLFFFISTKFLPTLSAASGRACIPVLAAGWIAQKRMIRGLAMGAIK